MRNIIFDWSGTLINNRVAMYMAVKTIFSDYGKKLTYTEFRKEFKQPLYAFYRHHLPDSSEKEIKEKFLWYYSKEEKSKLFPGILSALRGLKKSSSLFVFSSHPIGVLEKEMKENGLMSLITHYQGDVREKKEELSDFVSKHNLRNEETCYVGDMTDDIEAARRSKIASIAVEWGYQKAEMLSSAHPNCTLHFTSQLSKLQELNGMQKHAGKE